VVLQDSLRRGERNLVPSSYRVGDNRCVRYLPTLLNAEFQTAKTELLA
jgi:hypothetical protein